MTSHYKPTKDLYMIICIVSVLVLLLFFVFSGISPFNFIIFILIPIKKTLSNASSLLFPSPHSSLFLGILFGEQKELPSDFKNYLRLTGTIHIVVASGYNLTILITFVSNLFNRFLKVASYKLRFFIIEIILIGYTCFVGGGAPVVRAFVMCNVIMLGKLFGRDRNTVWILAVSAAVMLIVKPDWINDVSFQLSFLATLGLILFGNKFNLFFSKLFSKIKICEINLFGVFVESFSTTLAASVFVWPVLSLYFGQLSILSPLVNVLVLWIIPIVMFGGIVLLGFALVSPFSARYIAWFIYIFLDYFVQVVTFFGKFRLSSIKFSVNIWFLIFYYALVLFLVLPLSKRMPFQKL